MALAAKPRTMMAPTESIDADRHVHYDPTLSNTRGEANATRIVRRCLTQARAEAPANVSDITVVASRGTACGARGCVSPGRSAVIRISQRWRHAGCGISMTSFAIADKL